MMPDCPPDADAETLEEEARAERVAIETETEDRARAQGTAPPAGVRREPSPVEIERAPTAPVGGASGETGGASGETGGASGETGGASGETGGGAGEGHGVGSAAFWRGGLAAELRRAAEARTQQGVYLEATDALNWEEHLTRTRVKKGEGELLKTPGNLCLILSHHEQWAGRFRFNAMSLYPYLDGRQVTDSDLTALRVAIERRWELVAGRDTMSEAVRLASEADAYDPRVEWLRALPPWDGKKRLDFVAEYFFGTRHALYPAYVKCLFLGALRRVFEPGCTMQSVFTLQGPQGFKKSTFFRVLFGEWFSDTKIDFASPREAAIQLAGAWCHELGECEELTLYREDTATKRGITSATDTFRRPYAAMTERIPRSSFFVGTTNEENFLKDRTGTGSRRWHVVRVNQRIDEAALVRVRAQLFAEALVLLAADVPHYLSPEDDARRELAAADYYQDDPWDAEILRYVTKTNPGGDPANLFAVEHHVDAEDGGGTIETRWAIPSARVMTGALGLEKGKYGDAETRHAGVCLRKLGWLRCKKRFPREGAVLTGPKGPPESAYVAPSGWTVAAALGDRPEPTPSEDDFPF